jgi:hypothetical protein
MRITQTGINEQIMAAMPLGMYTSAHDTRPLPMVIIKNPANACLPILEIEGALIRFTKNIKAIKIIPPVNCLTPAKRNGGNPSTPMRITRKVVPQIMQIPAKHKYASTRSFLIVLNVRL